MQGLAVVLFPVLLMLFALGMEHLEQYIKHPSARQSSREANKASSDSEDHRAGPTQLHVADSHRRAS